MKNSVFLRCGESGVFCVHWNTLSNYGQYTKMDNTVLIKSEVKQMIVYDRLWETMKTRGLSQYRLIHYYNFSAGQLNRLKNNNYVSTHTLDVLCTILNCKIEDIMEFRLDPSQNREFGITEKSDSETAKNKNAQ